MGLRPPGHTVIRRTNNGAAKAERTLGVEQPQIRCSTSASRPASSPSPRTSRRQVRLCRTHAVACRR